MNIANSTFFNYAFRPLFLFGITWAIILIGWWVLAFTHQLALPPIGYPGALWHSHEMLFGFAGAAIGGFLLTAISNWTNRPPVNGTPLIILSLFWLSGRVAITFSGALPPFLVALADLSYLIFFTLLAAREVTSVGNKKNYKIIIVLSVLILTNLAWHLGWILGHENAIEIARAALRAGIIVVILLISAIGGRITPAFTRNWLNRQNKPNGVPPTGFSRIDGLAIASTATLAPLWAIWPTSIVTGIIALLAGCMQLARLSRWKGLSTLKEPLLLILHLGYSWIGIGYLLLAASILTSSVPLGSAIHALTLGAMMTMILGVSARAALGHTNREVSSSPLLNCCFILVTLATIARVMAGFIWYAPLLNISTLLMLTGLGIYAWIYVPILTQAAASSELKIL